MAAHRYWRIFILTTAHTGCGFNEIELRETPGGTDRTGSGTATAINNFPGWTPNLAVDNNNSTGWTTDGNAGPWWWVYDFGSGNAYDIREIYIVPRQDGGWHIQAPASWNWEWSDDGTVWTPQCIFSGIVWTSAAKTFDVTLRANGVYVTQEVVEVLLEGNAAVRASQELIEVVIASDGPVRASQEVIEVIINTSQAENPSSAVAHYSKAGLLVREADRGGAFGGQTAYCPRLALVWNGIGAAQIALDSATVVRTMSSDGLNYAPFAAAMLESKSNGVKFPDASVQLTAASQTPWTQNVDAAGFQLINLSTTLHRKEGFLLQDLWRVNGGVDGFAIQRDAVLNQHTSVVHYGTGNLNFIANTGAIRLQAQGSTQAETQADGYIKLGTGLRFPDGTTQESAAVASLTYEGGTGRSDTTLPRRPEIHFSGAGVIVTDDIAQQRTEVHIPGGTAPGADTVTSVFGRPGPAIVAAAGDYPPALLGTGTPDNTVFLRGDGVWSAGVSGPQGPAGPAGGTGPQGPAGPAGDPASNIITKVFGRTGNVVAAIGDYTWDQISDKPVQFNPTSHVHDWATGVVNKPSTYPPDAHSHTWASITSKPAWNSAHTEAIELARQLIWKQFGANHIIFDASQATTPPQSSDQQSRACSNVNSEVPWAASYPSLMGWNGASTYGLRVDACRYADSAGAVAWAGVSGKPAICYNDGGTYSINITGNAGTVGTLAIAPNAQYPPASCVLINSSNNFVYTNNVAVSGYIDVPGIHYPRGVEDLTPSWFLYQSGDPWVRRGNWSHLNNSINPHWSRIQSIPALCYNDGGTYSINITGSAPYHNGLLTAGDLTTPAGNQVLRTSNNGQAWLPQVVLRPAGGEGGEIQWTDTSGAVAMVADQAGTQFRFWRGASIMYLVFDYASNLTYLRISGVTYNLTRDANGFVKAG